MKIKSTIRQMARKLTELDTQGRGEEEVVIEYSDPTEHEMKIGDLKWGEETMCDGQDTLYTVHLHDGDRLTVLHRMTGFGYAVFDTETGYRNSSGKFWLASGNQDVRRYPDFTVGQAIEWVKTNANTCRGE